MIIVANTPIGQPIDPGAKKRQRQRSTARDLAIGKPRQLNRLRLRDSGTLAEPQLPSLERRARLDVVLSRIDADTL